MNVTIKNVENTEDAVVLAYEAIESYMERLPASARVVIKPNITAPKPPHTGVTTHHEILIGVLNALTCSNRVSSIKIVESDATSSGFAENIRGAGYFFLADHPDTELINLTKEPTRKTKLKGLLRYYEVELPEILFECDVLINLPVMKTHILTGVSLGIKNLFGLLPCKNKSLYHIYIHDLLFAILKRVQPTLTILDGIVGMEGMGPIFGQPANAKKILISEDVVALDAIATLMMGFEPCSIPYLKIAMDYRFGNGALSEIEVHGDIEKLNFNSIPTIPVQIIRAILAGANNIEDVTAQIDAPLQTIRNIPVFIRSLASEGIIMAGNNGELRLNTKSMDTLCSLFPEVKAEVVDTI